MQASSSAQAAAGQAKRLKRTKCKQWRAPWAGSLKCCLAVKKEIALVCEC